MKKTRRGGLGRGLGALIQSTADTDETTSSPSSSATPADSTRTVTSDEKKAATPRGRTTSAAAAASEKAADQAPAKETATGTSSGKSASTRSASSSTKSSTTKKPAGSTDAKGKTGTSGTKSSAKTSTARKETSAAAGTSSSSTGSKKSSTRPASTAKDAGDDAAAKKTAGAAKSTSGRNSRPVDVFFSSDRTPTEDQDKNADGTTSVKGEKDGKSSSTTPSRGTGTRSKSSARRSRPSMPAVSAPNRRAAAKAPDTQKTSENAAGGSAEATVSDSSASESTETGTVSTDIAVLRELKVTDIHPNPRQPREVFDEDHMDELVTSITEVGILQPVVVREVDGPTPYELIMGERRWRATQLAGLDTIPAIVRHTPDEDLLRDALLENLHRSQLNPLEEAAAYQQLMDDFQCTQEELSQRIGRSRPQISNTLRLMKLPPLVQRRVANNTLTAGHARALLGLTDPAEMERLAQRIVSEGLSVRATEEAVALAQGVRQAAPATRRRSEPTRHERLDYFATALTSRLDTQVKITLGKRKGKIAIDFASVEDLNRIMELIQGDDAQK